MINNKSILFALLIGVVLVAGCVSTNEQTPPTDKPYITNVNFDKSFGVEGDTINVAVSVANPTKVNYDGVVLIQSDVPNCFDMNYVNIGGNGTQQNVQGYLSPISVSAGTTNSVLLKMSVLYNTQATSDCVKSRKKSFLLGKQAILSL